MTRTPKSKRWTPSERARLVLLASVAATVALYFIPHGRWLIYPLVLLSTLTHELGHGVAAVLVGGMFHRFEMWPDGSGVAQWSGEVGGLGRAFVAAGGLVGPACAAALGFVWGRTVRGARACLLVAAALLIVAEVLVVRNLFGFAFVALVAFGCWAAARASGEVARVLLVFLSVQLALSVFSRSDYLMTAVAETSVGPMPSDVAQIAEALPLPFWFWGVVCGGLSVAVLIAGLRTLWR